MAYQRFLKPIYYPSFIPHYVGRGTAISSTVALHAGTLNTGSSIYDLFDGKPLRRVSFDTSAAVTTKILIRFDFGVTSELPFDFVAILNHNFAAASVAKIEVRHHTSAFTSVTDGTAVTLTEKVGASSGGAYTDNGSTIGQFAEVDDKRYWAIVIPYDGLGFSGTDLQIGQILLGRKHTASAGPDVQSIGRELSFDGVEMGETVGGQTYANAAWVAAGGADNTFGQPFHTASTTHWRRAGGRRVLKFRQHFMLDTEAQKEDITSAVRGDSFEENVMQITSGGLHPLIFCPDSASTTLGDYMFARINARLKQDEVAHNVRSMDVTVTEEL